MQARSIAIAGLALVTMAGVAACGDDDGDSVFSIGVGQCFDDVQAGGTISDVPVVDCAEPHKNEVFEVADIGASDAVYPGEDAVETAASEACLGAFDAYVGTTFAESTLDLNFLSPTESSWNEVGDREVICFLFVLDNSDLTGSVKGTGQ